MEVHIPSTSSSTGIHENPHGCPLPTHRAEFVDSLPDADRGVTRRVDRGPAGAHPPVLSRVPILGQDPGPVITPRSACIEQVCDRRRRWLQSARWRSPVHIAAGSTIAPPTCASAGSGTANRPTSRSTTRCHRLPMIRAPLIEVIARAGRVASPRHRRCSRPTSSLRRRSRRLGVSLRPVRRVSPMSCTVPHRPVRVRTN